MLILGALIGGLGLVCLLTRKSLLGIFAGIQLLLTGAALMFVMAGHVSDGSAAHGHVCALFIVISALAQLSSGLALAIRMHYLKGSISLEDMRSLKQ